MKRRVCLILAALLPLAGTSPALATVLKVSVAAGKSAPVSPAGAASVLRIGGSNITLGTVLPTVGLRSSLVGIQSRKLNFGRPVTAGAGSVEEKAAGVSVAAQAAVSASVAAPVQAVAPAQAASFKKKITNLAERLTGKSSAKKETAALPSASHWAVLFDGGLKHDELGEEPAGFADELRAEAEQKLAHLKEVPGFVGFTIDTGAPDAYWKQLRGKRYVSVRWRHPNDLMRFHDSGGMYPQEIGGQLALTDYESTAGIRTIGVQLAPAKPETEAKPAAEGPPSPAAKGQLRNYLIGTGIFKIGMEALSVSIPLLALTVFGSVTWAAVLAVGWGASQIVFSSFAGGLLDRHSPSKILSWAMGLQGLTVALLLSLFLVDMYLPGLLAFKLANPYVLLALYSLAGGFLGVADTARQVIPPEIIGEHEREIKIFNSKVHIAYEIAGVIGALTTGVIIVNFGLVPALILHPPAYLLAAFVFSRLKLGPRMARKRAASESANLEGKNASPVAELASDGRPIRRAFSDLWKGAKTVWSKPIFRWSALALIIPLVLHRLLEGLLIPVAAKVLLGNPAMAAWIIGASNAGELIGAILLWRSIKSRDKTKRFRSHIWVRTMSFGMMGLWVFTLRPDLIFMLPLVALGSMTWASSDLSLRSKLQNALPHRYRGRAFGFIGAVAFALILLASLGIGALMDAMAAASVFLGINIALVPLALLMFYAGIKLKKPKAPQPSK